MPKKVYIPENVKYNVVKCQCKFRAKNIKNVNLGETIGEFKIWGTGQNICRENINLWEKQKIVNLGKLTQKNRLEKFLGNVKTNLGENFDLGANVK